ncbi:MAG: DNA-binding protein WhiA [Symbiobacteriia bacterium]
MSFSGEVKEELARVMPDRDCCQRAELAGLIRSAGRLEIAGTGGAAGRASVHVETGQAAVARKLVSLGKLVLGLNPEVRVRRQQRLRRSRSFGVHLLSEDAGRDLVSLGVLDREGGLQRAIPPGLVAHGGCRRAYLRGLFLGSGSVTDPSRSHHLEIVLHDEVLADGVGQLLFGVGIGVRMTARRGELVLYIKEADQIGRLLATVGAHQALLAYENTLAMKTVKNRVNRLVNAETANLDKSVDAGVRQAAGVKLIEQRIGLHSLPPSLRELAELRVLHRDASLRELGELCTPPLGKSGVAHRLRKLETIAEELKGDSGKTSKRSPWNV